jgi:hypothetical protein
MRNKDIAVVEKYIDEDRITTKVLRINATSKVKKGTVFSMPIAVTVFERLTKFNKDLGFGRPNDYLFLPALSRNRGYAFQTLRLMFNHVLDKAHLKKANDGTPRTLYSLRHSSIMFKLINSGSNVDLVTLGTNCRTSPDILHRFYLSHLQAEMRIPQIIKQGAKPIGRQL